MRSRQPLISGGAKGHICPWPSFVDRDATTGAQQTPSDTGDKRIGGSSLTSRAWIHQCH